MNRREFLRQSAVATLLAPAARFSPLSAMTTAPASDRPNLVFLFSDQHRRDALGCAGSPWAATPRLDELAAHGTRFTQAYCPYPLCGPSRMAMLTGQYASRLGVHINEDALSSDIPTMAHALGVAGYDCVLSGRMHFHGADQRHGFQERLVGDVTACYAGGPRTDFKDLAQGTSNPVRAAKMARAEEGAHTDFDAAVADAAAERIRAQAGDGKRRPLFLTAGFFLPHHPFSAPEEHYQRACERLRAHPLNPLPPTPVSPGREALMKPFAWPDCTAEELFEVQANYLGMVEYMDAQAGKVIDAALELPGETWIVYSSDHGEMLGDHTHFGKMVFFKNSTGVPLIIARYRNGKPIGEPATVTCPVSLLDLAPTLTAGAGAPLLPQADGDSLLPLLSDAAVARDAQWSERPVISEMNVFFHTPSRSVRKGSWKANFYHGLPPELFNLENDPGELHNLGEDPASATVLEDLRSIAMRGWNPEALENDSAYKRDQFALMRDWGETVGLGPLDAWRP